MRKPSTELARARDKAGLTQLQVANEARVNIATYQRYEYGLMDPKAKIANRIAKVLHSTSEQLFGN